jgi:hypothetical protein
MRRLSEHGAPEKENPLYLAVLQTIICFQKRQSETNCYSTLHLN